MNRKTLYRGRCLDKKWVYGNRFSQFNESCGFIGTLFDGIKAVVPETIGQFTGFCDKNKIKIFEDDILKSDEGNIGVVQWFPEHAAFMIFCTNQHMICFLYDNAFSKIEVIGNLHDTPELIGTEAVKQLLQKL